jgi:hypothetical protein
MMEHKKLFVAGLLTIGIIGTAQATTSASITEEQVMESAMQKSSNNCNWENWQNWDKRERLIEKLNTLQFQPEAAQKLLSVGSKFVIDGVTLQVVGSTGTFFNIGNNEHQAQIEVTLEGPPDCGIAPRDLRGQTQIADRVVSLAQGPALENDNDDPFTLDILLTTTDLTRGIVNVNVRAADTK